MRKILRDKKIILIISVIVLALVYYFVRKAIDNYNMQENSEIVSTIDYENVENSTVKQQPSENTNEIKEVNTIEDEYVEDNDKNNPQKIQEESKKKIYVYVTGEVNNPGVYWVDEGSRIIDAIEAAGGTTDNANLTKINLVYVIEDGTKINIPSNKELNTDKEFNYITQGSGEGSTDKKEETKEKDTSKSSFNSKVNINTATQTELETLPGIGPSIALKIIKYRQENGKFTSIEEIKNVSGIGDSKYEEIKDYILL